MGYVVTTHGRDGMALFLVDRKKTTKHWWTTDMVNMMVFEKVEAAKTQASKLRYKIPQVISLAEARIRVRENDERYANDVHPFSEEAFES